MEVLSDIMNAWWKMGATAFSMMTLSIITIGINDIDHFLQYRVHAECHDYVNVMPSVVMVSLCWVTLCWMSFCWMWMIRFLAVISRYSMRLYCIICIGHNRILHQNFIIIKMWCEINKHLSFVQLFGPNLINLFCL